MDSQLRHLTWSDLELICLVAQGESNESIARRVHLSSATVRHYLSRLYASLRARNRPELVARAAALGLIDLTRWPPHAHRPPTLLPQPRGYSSVLSAAARD